MSTLKLVIGNKKYSSWSLRPWLLLRHAGVPFEEIKVSLYQPESKAQILRYSPAGKVPALIDGALVVWDSLAICEYVADRFPDVGAWPSALATRARARSIAAEMHSGFADLRMELPMNCDWPRAGVVPSAAAQADINRIVAIWSDCRRQAGTDGPWLFGAFSAADAMYAPVVIRFAAYRVALPEIGAAYMRTVLDDAPMHEWITAGRAETESIPGAERGTLVRASK